MDLLIRRVRNGFGVIVLVVFRLDERGWHGRMDPTEAVMISILGQDEDFSRRYAE